MSARSRFSGALRGLLRRTGREVVPYTVPALPALQRRQLMSDHGVTLVLDVGGNIGQTGGELRDEGYTGRIVSFEPLSSAFAELSRQANLDGNWECRQLALGESDGDAQINVSGFSASSSLLPMIRRHVEMIPGSKYVSTETIKLVRLDSIFADVARPSDRIMLKIDAQGYELPVLRGAVASLNRIALIQLEVSLVPLYEGQAKYHEVMQYLDQQSFDLVGIVPGFYDARIKHFLQADGLFVRRVSKPPSVSE
jgi:FkbM family methyltransferase